MRTRWAPSWAVSWRCGMGDAACPRSGGGRGSRCRWSRGAGRDLKGPVIKRNQMVTIPVPAAMLAVLVATAMSAQDKYGLKTSSGIAFSDFRGYESWAVVSSAQTDEVLKVIAATHTLR